MSCLKIETFATRSHAGFPARSDLKRRSKKDPPVDTLCEKVVVGDSNERISALSRNGEIPATKGAGTLKKRAGESEEALRTLCATWWKDLGRI